MSASEYDVVVIGAGPVGENAADRAVRGGLTAAIVESELVGGECSYWACMPSKALLRPVAAAAEANSLGAAASAALDARAVLERRDKFASNWKDDGQVQWLESAKIALYRGRGRLSGDRRVTVNGDTTLTARHAVVIATGSTAVIPPPLRDVNPWTSREATSARTVPESLAIVGGGVVGCEMAAAWQALGSRVTLIARNRLLDRLPSFAGDLVADGLREAGVDVRLGASVTSASRSDGRVTLAVSDGGTVEAAEVLAATGRAPSTGDIGLSSVGLEPGSWLEVDDTLRVAGHDWLYACGDVNHLALLTHMGKYQARICGDAIAARARGSEPSVTDEASRAAVPQVIFTVPEVASVGAVSARPGDRTVEFDLGNVAGAALFADGYAGKAQMVVDERRRVLTGVTLAGPGVGELIHSATIAVAGQVPLEKLWHAVPSYPTVSEVWLRLLETYGL